jgi:deaminated glutathione amidase
MTRIALLQMTSGIDPAANAAVIVDAVAEAATGGAVMLFTPEMSGLIDRDRSRAKSSVRQENEDVVLGAVCAAAAYHKIWVHIGSLAVDAGHADGKFANRAFVIDPQGQIVARYDKIHLFDVDLPTGESWRESNAYTAGELAVVADTGVGKLGISICYDLRFPALYAALSETGATVLAIPAAFTVPTGKAHWHILMRARAIENACFVVAAAQTGHHSDGRNTYGHSLVIGPWGDVVLDMGAAAGVGFCDIDLTQVADVRSRIPVIAHRRPVPSLIEKTPHLS